MEVLRVASFEWQPGEEALRETRLAALFRSNLTLRHFPIDLLRSTPGWEAAFAHSISDLEGAGLRPEDLVADSAQLVDVLTIWRALDQSAPMSWTNQRIYLEAAIVLAQRPEFWPFAGAVLAHGGTALTAAEARFIRAIPRVTVGLLAGRPVRKRYLERIEKLFGVEAAAMLATTQAPRGEKTERDVLASYLFEPPIVLADPHRPRSTGPDGTVHLEEHMGLDAELEATAEWVARQIDNGIPVEEIAVLAPTTDPFVGLIADRLERLPWHEGVFPVQVANGLPLTHFAAGARLVAVLRALRGYLAADLLADLLPALRLSEETGRHLSHGAAMDLVSSLGTAGGNPAKPADALEWSTRGEERLRELERLIAVSEAAAKANGEIDFAIRRRKRLFADLKGVAPALSALIEISRSVLQNAPLSSLWPMLQEFFERWLLQPGDVRHSVLSDRLESLATDSVCGSLSADDALKVIEDVILATRVGKGRLGEPAVYIGTVQGAAGLHFKAVRVIGLNEGHLPSLPREDPVLPDAIRQALKIAGGKDVFLPLTGDRALDDLHALDLVVRNSGQVIALSAPRLDAERSEREPSSIMLEAAAALSRPNRITGDRNSLIPDRTALTRDAFMPAREGIESFRRALPVTEAAWHDGVAQNEFGLPRRWSGLPNLELERIEQLSRNLASGPMDGLVGALAAELPVPGLSPEYPISASAIAQLLSCPHAFLIEHLLDFEKPFEPPPQREVGQPHYGTLFHHFAAKFYSAHGTEFCAHKNSLRHWLEVADRLVDSVFAEFLKEYPVIGGGVRAQQKQRFKRDIHELLEHDWEQVKNASVLTEKSFGDPVPVELRVGNNVLYLRGRIDRIEITKQKAVIRDLKTARARPRVGNATDPDPAVDLQIAVYGLVAEILAKEWKLPGKIEVGYAYLGGARFFEDFQTVLKPAGIRWLEIAAGLLNERQFPRTPNKDECTYCPFKPVCGDGVYDRTLVQLTNSTGAVAAFAALKLADSE
jgi:RecB family exonuclease